MISLGDGAVRSRSNKQHWELIEMSKRWAVSNNLDKKFPARQWHGTTIRKGQARRVLFNLRVRIRFEFTEELTL
jgi:hypothetical protein